MHLRIGLGLGGAAHGSAGNGRVGAERDFAREQLVLALLVHHQQDHVGRAAADLESNAAAFNAEPKTDVTPAKVTNVALSDDSLRATLELENLEPGRVYELRPSGLRAADGEPLATRLAAYTLNRLKE